MYFVMLADIVLLVHLMVIFFVLGGQVCIVIGYFKKWLWIRNMAFRASHFLTVILVVLQAWFGELCCLTALENDLRQAGGSSAYAESFIRHWVSRLIFYQAPLWVFILIYTLFGATVLLSWIWIRPHKK